MKFFDENSFEVRTKEDNSPVTTADISANNIITSLIGESGLPVLSEEGSNVPYEERRLWERFWLVDPLDGTKEFIKGNGEFTVNIALIDGRLPRAGVVYVPVTDILYAGIEGTGSWRFDNPSNLIPAISATSPETTVELFTRIIVAGVDNNNKNAPAENSWPDTCIPLPFISKKGYGIVASRSYRDDRTNRFIAEFSKRYHDTRIVSKGSSLKLCMLAEGEADIYPRFANISEWDTAAGHAIVLGSGGSVVQAANTDQQLIYNKKDSLNPWFIGCRNKELLENIKDLIPLSHEKDH